jgi:hypothetical protein
MTARMLVVLKRNVERATKAAARSATVSQDVSERSDDLNVSATG